MDILTSRIILRPRDYETTLAFYRDALELAVAREYPGGTVFFAGQSLIEVAAHGAPAQDPQGAPAQDPQGAPAQDPQGAPAQRPDGFAGAIWLQVRCVSSAATELALKGIPIDRSPVTEPWGLMEMWVHDPDGVPIVFVEIPEDHPLRRDTRG